jgi:hypothetical protein
MSFFYIMAYDTLQWKQDFFDGNQSPNFHSNSGLPTGPLNFSRKKFSRRARSVPHWVAPFSFFFTIRNLNIYVGIIFGFWLSVKTSPLRQLYRIFLKKKPWTEGLRKAIGQGQRNKWKFGGGGDVAAPRTLFIKVLESVSHKRIHQICNHITFTDMSDSWPIYLLYIWWEIDLILVLIIQ